MSYINPILLSFDELEPVPEQKKLENAQTQASVLIAITADAENPEIIFTRRADHLNSHSGQVSFPGGRWEPEDKGLMDTALRESFEEIALEPSFVSVKGCMGTRQSANNLIVQPYVGMVPSGLRLQPNPDEIADIFMVPIRFFRDTRPTRIDSLSRAGRTRRVPAWDFQGFDIWGLTAMFTYDLMKRLNIHIDVDAVQERRYD